MAEQEQENINGKAATEPKAAAPKAPSENEKLWTAIKEIKEHLGKTDARVEDILRGMKF